MLRMNESGKGITIFRRIRWAPLPLQKKASLIACLVGPAAMCGFSAGGFSLRLVNSLRTAVVAALWGTKRRSRCREIMLTLFLKGHLVDPPQNASYQSLRHLTRMAEQRPGTFAEMERVWRCHANGGEMCDGPAATVHSILQGWVGTGKHQRSSRGRSVPTGDCSADPKAGGSTRSGKD